MEKQCILQLASNDRQMDVFPACLSKEEHFFLEIALLIRDLSSVLLPKTDL